MPLLPQPSQSIDKIFGKISPPPAITKFIESDNTGTAGISKFLSNLIALFYTAAGVVLVFMLVWGAWDWLTSEGDKEKIAGARNKIISAVIGIALFAATFAIIAVLGQFTGFKFFEGQGGTRTFGGKYSYPCPDGTTIVTNKTDYNDACKGFGIP